MTMTKSLRAAAGYAWRVPLCALAYFGGVMASGAMMSTLGLSLPQLPEQADERMTGLLLAVASLILAAGLVPLVRRLQGSYRLRWMTLAVLCYVCLGLTSALEGAIFTTMDMTSVPVLSLLPCLLFGAVMALLFKPAHGGDLFATSARRFFRRRSAGQWAWRLAGAILAFPVVYWTFGMMVAPFVMEYYKQGQFALAVPDPAIILATQFARSALFLLAAVPVLILWSGSRRHLILALGLAFYVLVGLFGMIQSYWLAPTLQVLHNVEMLADSMAYAWALAILLIPGNEPNADELCARRLPCTAQAPVAG